MEVNDEIANIVKSGPVVVTGGAGFIGSHLVETLLADGKHVVLVDSMNDETSSSVEKNQNIELLRMVERRYKSSVLKVHMCDILNEAEVVRILSDERPTSCVHSAAFVMDRRSVESPREFVENNCVGTVSLLEAIRKTRTVRHMVYVSSRSVIGEKASSARFESVDESHELIPNNAYGASKAGGEHICRVYNRIYGITVNVCRLFPVYGPRGRVDMFPRRLLEAVKGQCQITIFGDGTAMRDWLFVDDAVEGLLEALWKPFDFEVFHFGTGNSTSVNEMVALVEELVGKKAIVSKSASVKGDAKYVGVCNTRKAMNLLSWKPKTCVREGLRNTLHYMDR